MADWAARNTLVAMRLGKLFVMNDAFRLVDYGIAAATLRIVAGIGASGTGEEQEALSSDTVE